MANKQKVEAREKARQKRKTEKTIMYIAIGVVVLVVLGIAWALWPESTPPEAAAPTDANAVPSIRFPAESNMMPIHR